MVCWVVLLVAYKFERLGIPLAATTTEFVVLSMWPAPLPVVLLTGDLISVVVGVGGCLGSDGLEEYFYAVAGFAKDVLETKGFLCLTTGGLLLI